MLWSMHCIICGVVHTLPLTMSMSMSAFLAHLSQKLGSSSEMSVRFPDATKLACKTLKSYRNHDHICHSSWVVTGQKSKPAIDLYPLCSSIWFYLFMYLCKGGSSPLRLNSDGLCPALEDLVDVLLTEFSPFVLLIHDGSIRTTSQQILNLLLGQLLLHCLSGERKRRKTFRVKKLDTTNNIKWYLLNKLNGSEVQILHNVWHKHNFTIFP